MIYMSVDFVKTAANVFMLTRIQSESKNIPRSKTKSKGNDKNSQAIPLPKGETTNKSHTS